MSSFADTLIIPIALFGICVALVFSYFIFNQMATADPAFLGVVAPQVNQTFGVLVNLIPLIMLGMALGAIVSALLIRAHPIFFGINILLQVILLLITPMLTNLWSSIMTADAGIQSAASSMTFIIALFNNLPLITFVLSALIGLVAYMRGA